MKQVSEARISSQGVESGIHPDRRQSIRTVVIGFRKPSKGLFLISQHGVQASHVKSADIALSGLAFDPVDHCVSLILPAGKRIGSRDLGQDHGILCGFQGAICSGKCLFRLAKFRIGER